MFLGDSLVSWSSKKQGMVSRSSEYKAMASLASEISWLSSLLKEIKFLAPRTPMLWCDNLSAKAIAINLVLHARTKHVEIDLHFICDMVQNKHISIGYVLSFEQPVYVFTKPLAGSRFSLLCSKLGMIVTPSRLRGAIK